jgi:cation transport protein ChaC
MVKLLRREIGGPMGYGALRLINLRSDDGPLRALCFYADPPEVADRPELPIETVASILARACGHIGSGAEYLFRTVEALHAIGIHDPHLWELQHLVANEIKTIHFGRTG